MAHQLRLSVPIRTHGVDDMVQKLRFAMHDSVLLLDGQISPVMSTGVLPRMKESRVPMGESVCG